MCRPTVSPTGTSTGNMADIPDSLSSIDIPGIRPSVGDRTVTSTSNLNLGYRRASVTVFSTRLAHQKLSLFHENDSKVAATLFLEYPALPISKPLIWNILLAGRIRYARLDYSGSGAGFPVEFTISRGRMLNQLSIGVAGLHVRRGERLLNPRVLPNSNPPLVYKDKDKDDARAALSSFPVRRRPPRHRREAQRCRSDGTVALIVRSKQDYCDKNLSCQVISPI
jgi:hypothetical protein